MLTPDTTKLMIFIPKSTQIRKMKKSSGLETPPRLFLTMAQTCSLPKSAQPYSAPTPNGTVLNSISMPDQSILLTTEDLTSRCTQSILLRRLSTDSDTLLSVSSSLSTSTPPNLPTLSKKLSILSSTPLILLRSTTLSNLWSPMAIWWQWLTQTTDTFTRDPSPPLHVVNQFTGISCLPFTQFLRDMSISSNNNWADLTKEIFPALETGELSNLLIDTMSSELLTPNSDLNSLPETTSTIISILTFTTKDNFQDSLVATDFLSKLNCWYPVFSVINNLP